MKKFPGVKAWSDEYDENTVGWDTNLVVKETGEPIPIAKIYDVQK